jgi:hypothetical protein
MLNYLTKDGLSLVWQKIKALTGSLSDLHTTNKSSIVAAINELKSSSSNVNYSTSEEWTGKTWVDGRKIYQKTFVATNRPTQIALGVTGMAKVVNYEALCKQSGYMPLPIYVSNWDGESIYNETLNFEVYLDSYIYIYRTNISEGELIITLYYTCTNR